jgi:hypothetical protein
LVALKETLAERKKNRGKKKNRGRKKIEDEEGDESRNATLLFNIPKTTIGCPETNFSGKKIEEERKIEDEGESPRAAAKVVTQRCYLVV